MNDLILNGVNIAVDSEGRFNLNDLHRASGGLDRHRPAYFFKLGSLEEMLTAIESRNLKDGISMVEPIVRKAGRYGGSWIVRALVYEYAMWVSADFRLAVIETFDSMVTGSKPPATMEYFNQVVAKCESDKEAASAHGRALAGYREIKKDNKARVDTCIRDLQWTLDL